jgi:hypothetical protein
MKIAVISTERTQARIRSMLLYVRLFRFFPFGFVLLRFFTEGYETMTASLSSDWSGQIMIESPGINEDANNIP